MRTENLELAHFFYQRENVPHLFVGPDIFSLQTKNNPYAVSHLTPYNILL